MSLRDAEALLLAHNIIKVVDPSASDTLIEIVASLIQVAVRKDEARQEEMGRVG